MSKAVYFVCTKETPWYPKLGNIVQHPDAVELKSGSDYTTTYKCPYCNKTWTEELPE